MTLPSELASFARDHGLVLSEESLAKGQAYVELLKERNEKVNLTADADEESLYLRHLADGLPAAAFLKRLLAAGLAPRVADLGSGGGFIGFSMKMAWPEAEVTLIESLQRKYDFLNLAAARSGLKGLRVVKARAGMGGLAGGFGAVVERALAPLPQAAALAAPLLSPGGVFVAFQSETPDLESEDLRTALHRAGLAFLDIMTYRLPREDRERRLVAFRREA
jgi:16S rRNA (guanine527-N7)-methyltransferase